LKKRIKENVEEARGYFSIRDTEKGSGKNLGKDHVQDVYLMRPTRRVRWEEGNTGFLISRSESVQKREERLDKIQKAL